MDSASAGSNTGAGGARKRTFNEVMSTAVFTGVRGHVTPSTVAGGDNSGSRQQQQLKKPAIKTVSVSRARPFKCAICAAQSRNRSAFSSQEKLDEHIKKEHDASWKGLEEQSQSNTASAANMNAIKRRRLGNGTIIETVLVSEESERKYEQQLKQQKEQQQLQAIALAVAAAAAADDKILPPGEEGLQFDEEGDEEDQLVNENDVILMNPGPDDD